MSKVELKSALAIRLPELDFPFQGFNSGVATGFLQDDTLNEMEGRLVLQLSSVPSATDLSALRAKYNLGDIRPFSYGDSNLWVATVGVTASRVNYENTLAASIMEDDLILHAEPETFFTAYGSKLVSPSTQRNQDDAAIITPNDTYYDQQWALDAIQLVDAWQTTTGSAEIVIAVLDSGVEMDHPDLIGNLVSGYDFVDDDNQPWDDLGHGTHVASVIGGLTNNSQGTAGINWQVKVMPIKVLNDRGIGSVQHIIEGIEWAVDHGADIINLSLGSPDNSRTLQRAVRRAVQNEGIVLVAASGNEYEEGNPVSYPAAYQEVIAVGAIDEEGNHANFSSSGEHIDLAAPGIEILAATWTGSGAEYAYYTGTSMSAPIVSGVVGLMLSVDNTLSPAQISTILTSNANDVESAGWDEFTGYGVVNAGASIQEVSDSLLLPTATPTPTPTAFFIPTLLPIQTTEPTSVPNTPEPTISPPPETPVSPTAQPTRVPSSPQASGADFTIYLPHIVR